MYVFSRQLPLCLFFIMILAFIYLRCVEMIENRHISCKTCISTYDIRKYAFKHGLRNKIQLTCSNHCNMTAV